MFLFVRSTEVYVMDEDTKLEVNPEARREIGIWPFFNRNFGLLRPRIGADAPLFFQGRGSLSFIQLVIQ